MNLNTVFIKNTTNY